VNGVAVAKAALPMGQILGTFGSHAKLHEVEFN
jgi:hypothetical protein